MNWRTACLLIREPALSLLLRLTHQTNYQSPKLKKNFLKANQQLSG
jgi:hypothetical protein